MARFCVADGITVIVATPHCHRSIHLLREQILPHVAALNEELQAADIPLTVLPGSEIQVFDSIIYRREFEEDVFCHLANRRAFTLLEFNWSAALFPPDSVQLIEWIRERGITPIIAHPERHDFFRQQPALLKPLVDAGAWLQVTVDSLLGNFGPEAQIFAEQFLRDHREAILATDSHNTKRCSGLSAGFEWVNTNLGPDRARDLIERSEQVRMALLAQQA